MLKLASVSLAFVMGAALAPSLAAASPTVNPAGEKLYKSACVACHTTGAANAPKLGDKKRWAPLIDKGVDELVEVAIKGKGAMPPKGASSADEATLRAAVEYMVVKSQ